MTPRPAWNIPAWYARPAARIVFVRRLIACGQVARIMTTHPDFPGAFSINVRLRVDDLPVRSVTIVFTRRNALVPRVYADGPSRSPHRYTDRSLCMWYPYDPPEQRWRLRDGPEVLLGLVVAHLLREEWWRRTGEWPGEEAPHAPPEA